MIGRNSIVPNATADDLLQRGESAEVSEHLGAEENQVNIALASFCDSQCWHTSCSHGF